MTSKTFLIDREQAVALGVTARTCGARPSALIGILNKTVALAFDNKVSMALWLFENEIETARFRALAGVPSDTPPSDPNAPRFSIHNAVHAEDCRGQVFVDGELRGCACGAEAGPIEQVSNRFGVETRPTPRNIGRTEVYEGGKLVGYHSGYDTQGRPTFYDNEVV